MQPPGILQGNSVLRGDRAPRCKRHLASHILGCAPLGNWVALTGPILVPKTPCGSSSMQNSRQRIGFWAITGVQPIEYGKEGQVTGCLKFLILGVRLKIRSFGGSFEVLVLQGGRFRRKRGVSEAGSEKAGGCLSRWDKPPPLENNSQNGRGYAKRPLRILGCSVWAMLAAP